MGVVRVAQRLFVCLEVVTHPVDDHTLFLLEQIKLGLLDPGTGASDVFRAGKDDGFCIVQPPAVDGEKSPLVRDVVADGDRKANPIDGDGQTNIRPAGFVKISGQPA